MDKKAKFATIVGCCEKHFGRGNSIDWKHSDFTDLSRAILRDTGVNISANTLKRIFGKISVDDDYQPQQATIDALALYGKCPPVEKELFTPELQPVPVPEPAPVPELAPIPEPTKAKPQKRVLAAIILLAVLAGGFIAFRFFTTQRPLSATIGVVSVEGTLPATVFFTLQLPQTDDSLYVNFGDKSTYLHLLPNQKTIAHKYLFPGVFHVALQVKGKVLDTTTVYIRSGNWVGLGYHRQADLPYHYYAFPASKRGTDSLFTISNDQLIKVGLDTTGSVFTRLCNFSDAPSQPDNFELEATFKNAVKEKGMYCNSAQFQVSGINNIVRFKLVSRGCSSEVLNVVSENRFEGRTTNLSRFAVNLEQWNTIKITNQNKHITLWVNNDKLYEGGYQQSLGAVKGVFLEFEGVGFIKYCQLSSEGKVLYHF